MDTNAARNALAQTYQQELSVNCILTPSKRAASDQTAQINLSETYQRNLELDGHWKAESIIFIVVRTDESIDVEDHLEKNPDVVEKVAHVIRQEQNWTHQKSLLEAEIITINTNMINKKKILKGFSKDIRKLYAWLRSVSDIEGISAPVKRAGGTRLLKAGTYFPAFFE